MRLDGYVKEAVSVLGPMETDEPTEDQFAAFMLWADQRSLGPATAMSVYEAAVLELRGRTAVQI